MLDEADLDASMPDVETDGGATIRVDKAQFDELLQRQVEAEQERIRSGRAESVRPVHDPGTEWFKAHRKYFYDLSRNPATKDKPSKVAYYCWAKHNRDGHCPLERGELQRLIGRPDMLDKVLMRDVIKPAIERQLLAVGSVPACLVAPEGVWYDLGPRTKWCEHHRGGEFKAAERSCFGTTRPYRRAP